MGYTLLEIYQQLLPYKHEEITYDEVYPQPRGITNTNQTQYALYLSTPTMKFIFILDRNTFDELTICYRKAIGDMYDFTVLDILEQADTVARHRKLKLLSQITSE